MSSGPEEPTVLTPSILLMQKVELLSATVGDFDASDLSSKRWRKVQGLVDAFCKRWRLEYLTTLEPRKKWHAMSRDLHKDAQAKRTDWLTGLVVKTIPSQDGRVQNVEVKVVKQCTPKVYLRPISEVVFLFHNYNT